MGRRSLVAWERLHERARGVEHSGRRCGECCLRRGRRGRWRWRARVFFARSTMDVTLDPYEVAATAAYSVLLVGAGASLLLRTHNTAILRTFALLACLCAGLRVLGTVLWQQTTASGDWWYLVFTLAVMLAPTVFLAQLAVIVKTWALAYLTIFDKSKQASAAARRRSATPTRAPRRCSRRVSLRCCSPFP